MAVDITRFLLRIPAELHLRIRQESAAEGLSMNEFCVQRLTSPAIDSEAGPLIADAERMFGRDLIGVVEYGSVARGESAPGSDLDLLLILDRRIALTRELYREWDGRPHIGGGRSADAHFTYLPDGPTTGGIWAEAAVDGRVLFERDCKVTGALRSIRNDIAEGRLRRRSVHGQTYWTAA